MNIGFDSSAMFGKGSKNRGIGNYSVSLFSTLIKNDKENNYFFLNCHEDTSFETYLDKKVSNFCEEILYTGENLSLISSGLQAIYGDILKTFLEKNKIDIFIITSPFDFSFPYYKKEWFGKVKVYCIVYDIIPYVMKNEYLRVKEKYNEYMEYLDAMRFCDRYLVISKSVKDDLVSYLSFDPNKIDIIYAGYDSHFEIIDITQQEKNELYEKFNVHDGFIMCTGGDDYRKNIDGLIKAYSELPIELRKLHQLVIVCKISPTGMKIYNDLIVKLNLIGSVILTNFVSTEELIKFYNLAYLMAFPSKYEGFGLPVVEAWACGTPVLTSNNSSLGEIADDGAITVNPFSISDITKGLKYALTEADLDKLLEKGRKRNDSLFNWDKVAELTIKSINKTVPVNIIDDQKHRIAMFTPLTPIQSGISDYSEDIIRELSKYFDIDVFIDNGYSACAELPENVSVYPHTAYPSMSSKYFDTVYQVGNSEYHVYMYDYVAKYSGTVVLHDFNMTDIAMFLRNNKKAKIFKKFIEADCNAEDAEKIYKNIMNPPVLNGIVVNPATKIIVHDENNKRSLLERNFGKKIFVIPHYAKPENIPENTDSLREKYGFNKNDIIFAAFGIIARSKRIIPLVKAFVKAAEDIPNAKLLLCGKTDTLIDSELNSIINSSGVASKIKITGFTELNDFTNYMDICDICFNMRFPYRGESSGTLARALAKRKIIVVNKIGSFDSIPDNACIKLSNVEFMTEEEEINAIYDVMRIYANDREQYLELAKNGRDYAENVLDIKTTALKYREALLSPQRFAITKPKFEEILTRITSDHYATSDLKKLAHTIAYSKNEI